MSPRKTRVFGISFGEVALIVVIGLIVIGPQRLPETARFFGHIISRLQRQVHSVKTDIRREMDLEDLKDIQKEYQNVAREVENTMRSHADDLNKETTLIQKNVTASGTTKAEIAAAHSSGETSEKDSETTLEKTSLESGTTSESTSENASEKDSEKTSLESIWPNPKGSAVDNSADASQTASESVSTESVTESAITESKTKPPSES